MIWKPLNNYGQKLCLGGITLGTVTLDGYGVWNLISFIDHTQDRAMVTREDAMDTLFEFTRQALEQASK